MSEEIDWANFMLQMGRTLQRTHEIHSPKVDVKVNVKFDLSQCDLSPLSVIRSVMASPENLSPRNNNMRPSPFRDFILRLPEALNESDESSLIHGDKPYPSFVDGTWECSVCSFEGRKRTEVMQHIRVDHPRQRKQQEEFQAPSTPHRNNKRKFNFSPYVDSKLCKKSRVTVYACHRVGCEYETERKDCLLDHIDSIHLKK